MSNVSPSLFELIEGRRWRRAVFTSFTLSLTYLESYLLPRLRAQGCVSIDIFVDALGYRDSLIEQRSRHAGRDYSVHPVVVRTGIFHPKLVYLWPEGDDGDLLLVGSGNLTYAGHGGNLEVFEVLRPELHASAFAQAAAFFSELTRSQHVEVGGGDKALDAVYRRMSALAKNYRTVQDVRFVHSLNEPAIPQLVRHLAGQTFDELVVMSPYHNPDASTVAQLVDATRPARVLISLDIATPTSPFPFELADKWPCDVRAVTPNDTKARFAHAKWYEWRTVTGATAFTGSFNATTASLATCNNVECGVIRQLSAPSTHWSDATRRPFQKQVFPRTNNPSQLIAQATLTGNVLKGRVLGYTPTSSEQWTWWIQNGDDAPSPPQSLKLEPDGSFTATLLTSIDVTRESAMQIHLESPLRSARGWVSIPDILDIAPQQRNLLTLLARLDRGAGSAASFVSLLNILMDEIRQLNLEASKASLGTLLDRPRDGPATPREWTALPRASVSENPYVAVPDNPQGRFLAALGAGQRSWETWGHLGQALLGISTADITSFNPSTGQRNGVRPPRLDRFVLETDEEANATERENETLRLALAAFQELMTTCRETLRGQLEREALDTRGAALLALAQFERMWLHIMLRALVVHLNSISGTIEWIGNWLHENAYIGYAQASFDLLLPEMAGCAAVLAFHAVGQPDALYSAIAAKRAPSPATRTVMYLEAAFNGAPNVDLVLAQAHNWLGSQVCNELVEDNLDAALEGLEIMLARPTPRSRIAQFLLERPSKVIPSEWYPLPGRALDLLKISVRPIVRRPHFAKVHIRNLHRGCPLCHQPLGHILRGSDIRRLDPDFLADFKLLCIAACIHCKAPLIAHFAMPLDHE